MRTRNDFSTFHEMHKQTEMRNIIHITADYPDKFNPKKTSAVKKLLDMTPEFQHVIYSLNRTNGLKGIQKIPEDAKGLTTLTYKALPMALMQETFLNPVADWICNDIESKKIEIDLIHAHKMTVEGVIAKRIARKLDRPFICSLWGNTDQKFLRMKPEKRRLYKKIANESLRLLPATPWIQHYIQEKLSVPAGKFAELPVVTDIEKLIPSLPSQEGIAILCNLNFYKPKGIPHLLQAIAELSQKGREIKLAIMGGGHIENVKAVKKQISDLELQELVTLTGPIPHEEVQKHLNKYTAFVMPTLTETYGMVFIEALFSGIPILYTEGRGIDGYFDDVEIGYRCKPASVEDIVKGIEYLIENEKTLKENIKDLQQNGFFLKFDKYEIAKKYSDILNSVAS